MILPKFSFVFEPWHRTGRIHSDDEVIRNWEGVEQGVSRMSPGANAEAFFLDPLGAGHELCFDNRLKKRDEGIRYEPGNQCLKLAFKMSPSICQIASSHC